MDRNRPPDRATGSGGVSRDRRQRVAVYGICEDGAGCILLVRAAAHLTVAGQWFLPGGGIDHGEDLVDALHREFAEETGLSIEVGDLVDVQSDLFDLPDGASMHTVRIIYRIRSHRGVLRDEVGGSSDTARWVPLVDAGALPLRPYVRRALAALR
jgi:8-oxo-dGTP pyrophosphatase MutT (NUDIX family)